MEAVHVSPRGKEALQLITTLLPTPFTQRFRLLFSPLVQTHKAEQVTDRLLHGLLPWVTNDSGKEVRLNQPMPSHPRAQANVDNDDPLEESMK